MNLVVVARRPEVGERCAATIQLLTGRHPSRTIDHPVGRPGRPVVARRADRGPLRAAARRTRRRPAPRRSTSPPAARPAGTSRAIVAPLLIHDLPVTVWWPGEPPFGQPAATRPARRRRTGSSSTGRTWSGDGLDRLRELAGVGDRRRLAISDFALVRQSRWREAIASIFDDPGVPAVPALAPPDRGHLRRPTTRPARRVDQPRQAALPRRLARLAARACTWSSRSAAVGGRAARDGRRGRGPAPRRPLGRGPRGDAVRRDRSEVARGRPAGPVDDAAGHDPAGRAPGRAARLRAAGRRDRRGRDGPRPGLAGRRRGPRPAVPRAAPDRGRPAGRGHRGRRRDPVAVGTLRLAAEIAGGTEG